jgi:hypothetical protein
MASPSPQADANGHRGTVLHAVPSIGYSLHSGTARSPAAPNALTRPDPRPIHPNDLAQSRLFQTLLVDEIDELEDLITTAVRRWERQRDLDPESRGGVPRAILLMRERLTEARRLLDALNRRFPPD